MSLFDKAAEALTPMESDEERADARAKARDLAGSSGWLATILDHHLKLEDAFTATREASDAGSRKSALKSLGVILTGHAIAEEAAIYPAMASGGERSDADHAYKEQATVKMQMAELEKLDPMSPDFIEKLESIREAVAHHMYEEEGDWFPQLVENASTEDQAMIQSHYNESFERFVGVDSLQPA